MRRKRYTLKEKLKIIYRKEDSGNVVAFLPELPANHGNIVCYTHTGQHGEASMNYYGETRTAKPEEYATLHEELKAIYNDIELNIKQRVYYNDLSWRRSK